VDIQLDQEEQELLASYEAGEWVESGPAGHLVEIAKATLAKTRRVNLRLSEMDVVSLQLRAAREGIPPQTLMGSILHKYATGLLKDVA
jgi:predicted DNA binding CopG/RHH family protein